jgi:hypothetical protein
MTSDPSRSLSDRSHPSSLAVGSFLSFPHGPPLAPRSMLRPRLSPGKRNPHPTQERPGLILSTFSFTIRDKL